MKKLLLSGNEAIARGAYEAGITFAAAYPGTPSTEILENVVHYRDDIYCHWGANEKTAFEEAFGACFTGARSLVAMKHVGLNVAADPFFSSSYIGVDGGFVIVSADDPGMHSSQNEQDNRNYGIAAKMIVLEPSDSQEAKDLVKEGIKISEQFDTPVLIRLTTRISHSRSIVNIGERETPPEIEYKKDDMKRMLLPARARRKHVIVEERQKKLEEFCNQFKYNRIVTGEGRVGVVASGMAYYNGREAFQTAGMKPWFLKITTPYPFPTRLFLEFARQVDEIYVLEENDPVIERFARLAAPGKKIVGKEVFPLTGEMTADVILESLGKKSPLPAGDTGKIPLRPPSLCAGCPHTATFYNLKKMKVTVTGDIGCYTLGGLPPLSAMDTCIDMGASVSALLGMEKALEKAGKKNRQVAVIGDSTFFHSGITGLLDIIYNNGKSTVIVLDNSITAMTGHQENPGSGTTLMGEEAPVVDIVKLGREGLGMRHCYQVDGYDVRAVHDVLKREIDRPEPSLIVVKRPCVLLYRKARWSPMTVDEEKCTGCKLCLRIGCPAISRRGEKARIESTLCTGCNVCAQLCPADAIHFVDPEGLHIGDMSLEKFKKGGQQ